MRENVVIYSLSQIELSRTSIKNLKECISIACGNENVKLFFVDETDLTETEDYRIDFNCGEVWGSVWYAKTRIKDIIFVTETCIDKL